MFFHESVSTGPMSIHGGRLKVFRKFAEIFMNEIYQIFLFYRQCVIDTADSSFANIFSNFKLIHEIFMSKLSSLVV